MILEPRVPSPRAPVVVIESRTPNPEFRSEFQLFVTESRIPNPESRSEFQLFVTESRILNPESRFPVFP